MGVVFDIQKCCLHDGPGIRTTVFLKGCNLRCAWCHNPESFCAEPELFWQRSRCTACGACVASCPRHVHAIDEDGTHHLQREACVACGQCVALCPNDALRLYGQAMTAQEVFDEVRKDALFYQSSGGGVTLSGGESTLQAAFALEILTLCQQAGFHTALETNGSVPWAVLESFLPVVDLFLYDFKHWDSEGHRQYTGVGNERVVANLRQLAVRGTTIWLRCPIIPGVNDTDAHFDAIASLEKEIHPERVEIMAYHDIGRGKWDGLGLPYAFDGLPSASPEQKAQWEARLAQAGR